MKSIQKLRQNLLVVARLSSAVSLLGWDQEVNLPPKGQDFRGEVSAQLAADLHQKMTDKSLVAVLKELHHPDVFDGLSADEQVIVRETYDDVTKAAKLPTDFVRLVAKLTSQAFGAWAEARQKSDFTIFQPFLQKIVAMSVRQADYLGYKQSPYDALLDTYEPGLTSQKISRLFDPLSKQLTSLLKQADTSPRSLPKATYGLQTQKKLNYKIAQDLGYDLEAGRIDESPHPFTIGFHPSDVRITTRYDQYDFWTALGSTIHETGHALYQQGLPVRHFSTPLGEPVSLGVHESQSRIWENFVAKSRAFVDYLHPQLVAGFGQKMIGYDRDELYAWLNRVQPNLIRVESDEVSYNLHIVIRFEIEKDLIEGNLKAADVPACWNQKMKQYLNLEVADDATGCLQDIHWSHGTFGYFPTYTLGNLYAAQLYHKIENDIPDLQQQFSKGDFSQFLGWLRREIHAHGRKYNPEELLIRATGEPLNPDYLVRHLRSKIKP